MKDFLGWLVLLFGLGNILACTLLFPVLRRLNRWLLYWYTRVAEQQRLPFVDLQKQMGEWWLAREGLQRALGMVQGLILLIIWWFVWGPGAA
jgi:hypothetical protein